MNTIIIFICKIIALIGKKLKRGSTLPGFLALKLNPNIFKHFKLNDTKVIVVTGSNGKGSTSSLICDCLRKFGYSVGYNDSGSNLSFAILTTMILNSKITGQIKTNYLVFELDERYSPIVFKNLKVDFTVITNITRDQPPRQGNPEIVSEIIKKGLNNTQLILNADDPMLQQFTDKNIVHFYDIKDDKQFYTKNIYDKPNIAYCPNCYKKLKNDYYIFEQHGKYHCKCGFSKPEAELSANYIDYDRLVIMVENFKFNLAYPSLFDVNNTMAAILCLKLLGFELDKISYIMNFRTTDNKIFSSYILNNRFIYTINNKNENSASFNQSLLLVNRDKKEKIIVIGWKEISRRYEFNDISWLYDIDFEILKELNVKYIYCVGIERYDIALRMKFAGLEDKVKIYEDLKCACIDLKKDTCNIYAVLNFDFVEDFNNYIRREDEN